MTEASGSMVYFSPIYDTKLNQPLTFSSNVIASEFVEYLKGRYDYNAPGNFPAGCPIFRSMSQAEASRRDFEARARQANKQVVEVDWRYVVDEDKAAVATCSKQ